MWIRIVSAIAALALVASTAYLWWKNRRLKTEASGWAALAERNQDTCYRMACDQHGKDAVDRAIREAHARGTN